MAGLSFLFGQKKKPVPTVSLGFPEIIRRSLTPRKAYWRSRVLSPLPLISFPDPGERILKVLTDLTHPKSPLRRQAKKYLGTSDSVRFWESADALLPFADPFRKLLELADDALPSDGTLLDLAAGSLNFTLHLLLKSPDRRFIAVDSSRLGMLLGKKKLELAIGAEATGRHRAYAGSVADPLCPARDGDAAILCALPGGFVRTPAHFRLIRQRLRPGATIVLIEPTAKLSKPERLRKFLFDLAVSASAHRAPLTEFDLAVVAVAFEERRSPLPSAKELEAWAQEAGFDILVSKSLVGGAFRFLKLRRL